MSKYNLELFVLNFSYGIGCKINFVVDLVLFFGRW